MNRDRLLAVARGEAPADLVLRNARVLCVHTGEILDCDVVIAEGRIAGLGDGYDTASELDVDGRYVAPGLIDAHVHIESSLVTPRQFARAVVPRGVTTVITDPHEIASVLGLEGVRFMLRDAEGAPLQVLVNAPSCVPASPLATSAATLEADDLARLLEEPNVLGLAEVMNFPGVVAGDPAILAKLDAFAGRPIDGHCPALTGAALDAYVAAGISSDHESTAATEAREKLRRGMTILLREASCARDLDRLLPLVDRWTEPFLAFCTDDRLPTELLEEGSIDALLARATARGIDPIAAWRMATLNPARQYGLDDRGAVAPGRRADLLVVEELERPVAESVLIGGRLAARAGEALFAVEPSEIPPPTADPRLPGAAAREVGDLDLTIPARPGLLRVIELIPRQIVTGSSLVEPLVSCGKVVADPERDLAKLAVIERHRDTGNVGLGFVRGFALCRGALASTVAHDCHNLVVVGMDDTSMRTAARAALRAGGGLAAANGEHLCDVVELPIAGLMSARPVEDVRLGLERLLAAARALGSPLENPFMALSFLALEVVPELKLTDRGLVDVGRGQIVPLFAE